MPQLFLDPLLASAGLDRLLHHAEVLVITGPSFRAQERQLPVPEPVLPVVELAEA